MTRTPGSILYLPHGGGPLPLLGDIQHRSLLAFLQAIPAALIKPSAILLISAHWETPVATLTSGATPPLIYDYAGFPDQAYEIDYPAPGKPALADTVHKLLGEHGIQSQLNPQRGFDHGLFVPLKIMFPDADIPCVQLSLVNSLDPRTHIDIGNALRQLKEHKVLIIGSGFSFHNMQAFITQSREKGDPKNQAFHNWLIETCTDTSLGPEAREERLVHWLTAPHARYCHPREEHLLPLHVCCGAAGLAGKLVFDDKVIGKRSSAFVW